MNECCTTTSVARRAVTPAALHSLAERYAPAPVVAIYEHPDHGPIAHETPGAQASLEPGQDRPSPGAQRRGALTWSQGAMTLAVLAAARAEVAGRHRRQIVGCGSGLSTLVLASLVHTHGSRLLSLEHDQTWATRSRSNLAAAGWPRPRRSRSRRSRPSRAAALTLARLRQMREGRVAQLKQRPASRGGTGQLLRAAIGQTSQSRRRPQVSCGGHPGRKPPPSRALDGATRDRRPWSARAHTYAPS